MFQTFISRHNSNFFSDKLVLTSVTPASSAPVLQTPKATSSTLYFDSLTVNAGNGGFLHCIQMDTSVNAANQVVSVGADIAFDADPSGRLDCIRQYLAVVLECEVDADDALVEGRPEYPDAAEIQQVDPIVRPHRVIPEMRIAVDHAVIVERHVPGPEHVHGHLVA